MEGSSEKKRAQTTPDASFGPLVSSFSFQFFLILSNVFMVYIGYEIRDRKLEGSDGESGPKRRARRPLGH